jgi:hypothetical protein
VGSSNADAIFARLGAHTKPRNWADLSSKKSSCQRAATTRCGVKGPNLTQKGRVGREFFTLFEPKGASSATKQTKEPHEVTPTRDRILSSDRLRIRGKHPLRHRRRLGRSHDKWRKHGSLGRKHGARWKLDRLWRKHGARWKLDRLWRKHGARWKLDRLGREQRERRKLDRLGRKHGGLGREHGERWKHDGLGRKHGGLGREHGERW